MKKTIVSLLLASFLTLVCTTAAFAYEPGRRTVQLLGNTLNSDKHAVHIVLEQILDKKGVLKEDVYNALPEAEKRIVNRAEYNEYKGVYAERNTSYDGAGNVIKDVVRFVKGGRYYMIDHKNKACDSLPEILGMSASYAETFKPFFIHNPLLAQQMKAAGKTPLDTKPQMGFDEESGCDYDLLTTDSGMRLMVLFEKDSDKWVGIKRRGWPIQKAIEVSEEVDPEVAFALPPADYKHVPDQLMRNYANRTVLMRRR